LQTHQIYYWRNKRGHEIDFILTRRGYPPIAIECKWTSKNFDQKNLIAFWKQYPEATIFIVSNDVDRAFTKEVNGMKMRFINLADLLRHLITK
jgi:hypothetical protein